MAFNGAGTFQLVAGNPVVTGTIISSTWANNTLQDIANNGLTNCITKDGQTTPTANIPLGGFRLTGLADAVNPQDAVTARQIQGGALSLLSTVAGTNTITATTSPAVTSYTDSFYWFTAAGANTGAVTLNINGLGAKNVNGLGGVALQGGEIVANGKCLVAYSVALGVFILVACSGGALQVAPATQSGHAAQLSQAGFQNMAVYINNSGTQFVSVNGGAYTSTGATTFAAPISGRARVRVWGAGGGSGATFAAASGSLGGAGGGYSECTFTGIVSATAITVGQGGTAGVSSASPTNGGAGGTSSFGALVSCTGGTGGIAANGGIASGTSTGGGPTVVNNAGFLVAGSSCGSPFLLTSPAVAQSTGGGSFGSPQSGGGASNVSSPGKLGSFPGGGAAGSVNQANGAAGGNGLVIVEW